jgi:NADH-quinone oxidoreductase subunit M
LGGLAHTAPALAILLVIIALANIGLPLTNGFIGEFTMFAGLFQFNAWYAAFAGISIILAAVYMLNMIQKVFFGERLETEVQPTDINLRDKLVLYTIVGMILFLGVFPKPIFRLVDDTVTNILTKLG